MRWWHEYYRQGFLRQQSKLQAAEIVKEAEVRRQMDEMQQHSVHRRQVSRVSIKIVGSSFVEEQ